MINRHIWLVIEAENLTVQCYLGDDLIALNITPNVDELYNQFISITEKDFADFGLEYPTDHFMQPKSRTGYHTEYFGFILCELQYMQRAYPGCTW